MIDLEATGPIYKAHKLSRIVTEFITGQICNEVGLNRTTQPYSTKAWARLDVRVIGNCWGLSVSDVPHQNEEN